MKHNNQKGLLSLLLMGLIFISCQDKELKSKNLAAADPPEISGRLMDGVRVIPVTDDPNYDFHVFLGDHLQFQFTKTNRLHSIVIPQMKIHATIENGINLTSVIEVTQKGEFLIQIDGNQGILAVKEYEKTRYGLIDSHEANRIIGNVQPFLLDVRSPAEYTRGHLENSLLIPVHELKTRLDELNSLKNGDILVYCASGNRSTSASKILIDNGFRRIYNMKDGFSGWLLNKLPYVND